VTVQIGTAANPTAYTAAFPNLTTGANPIVSNVRTPIMDPREALGGNTAVNLTTVDINALNVALTGAGGALGSNAALAAAYNGVVYVNDATDNTHIGASGTLNGILIKNGSTTPNVNDQNGNPLGFTVVSNNGLYVQGDYNTTQITAGGTQVNNPAAIMGDAITALSATWTPAENAPGAELSILNRPAGVSPSVPANNSVSPTVPANPGTNNGMTVNAAILTGNTPSTSTYNSGGVQNLVRMVEDWYDPDPLGNGTGMQLTLNGSLGQLFTSKYYTGAYKGNGVQASLPLANDRVYLQPKTRNFNYDIGFKSRLPAGSPTTTNFARGDFFFW
jgi:hypothetical protein